MAAADLALRLRACERVRNAVTALSRLGPVSQVIDRCAAEAAAAVDLDRALLSRIENGTLLAERLHLRTAGADRASVLEQLRGAPLRLSYPLLECELMRRRKTQLVDDIDHEQPGRYAFLDALGWRAYVAAPIIVDGSVIGLLHGDREPGRRPLAQLDADALEHFAAGFAMVFERAVLRRRLRDQRLEIHRIATWAEARTGELSDDMIVLAAGAAEEHNARLPTPETLTEDGLDAHLTAREFDVLRLMAEGKTNSDIAQALFVSAGTVKFHVKNILRKMQASNRADAGARYLRQMLGDGPGSGATPTLR
jgi:DNA-binding CsgD family transcriptional regulator